MSDVLVVIPTYNEIDNVSLMIEKIFSLTKDFHILIVDDSSPDGTGKVVKSLQKKHFDNLFLLERKKKEGLGLAYIAGFNWGLSKKYNYFIQMDCDFSHDPNDLVRLYKSCNIDKNDLAIGSRYISGINVVNWPMSRILLSYFASKYVRFFTCMNIRDTTAGFNCYSREVFENINFNKIKFSGYGFQIEMKFRVWKMGFKIKEIPIIFRDRERGKSKISGGIIWEGVFGVFGLLLRSLIFRKEFKRKIK